MRRKIGLWIKIFFGDENYDFINSNIEIVNLLAEQDVVSVTEEKL